MIWVGVAGHLVYLAGLGRVCSSPLIAIGAGPMYELQASWGEAGKVGTMFPGQGTDHDQGCGTCC